MTRIASNLAAAIAVTFALSGCGPSENEPGPGGVTVSEARALDEAAEMIERRRLPPGAIREEQPGTGAAPTPSGDAGE